MTRKEHMLRRMGILNEHIFEATMKMHKTLMENPCNRSELLISALANVKHGAPKELGLMLSMMVEISATLLLTSYFQAEGNLEKMEDFIRIGADKQREGAAKTLMETFKA